MCGPVGGDAFIVAAVDTHEVITAEAAITVVAPLMLAIVATGAMSHREMVVPRNAFIVAAVDTHEALGGDLVRSMRSASAEMACDAVLAVMPTHYKGG